MTPDEIRALSDAALDAAIDVAESGELDVLLDEKERRVFCDTGDAAETADSIGSAAEFADDTLALQLAERYPDMRFTALWCIWLIWNGWGWIRDETLQVFNRAREVCRRESAACDDDRLARRVASAATVAAVVQLARADRRYAACVDQWDADPWLLNTRAGVVDLHAGTIRPARREDYCTKTTAVSPGGDYPRWQKFLDRITNGDRDLEAFLQRMCGYALTGITREHALFFLYGTGANGKSVFLNTICGLMGDYSKTAPIETFTDTKNQSHPTDMAGLQGARLVTASETEEGRRWAESKVKALTGGDRIAARFMRQNFFEYVPQFKLILAGNHKPGLRSVDEATRRRFNLIPFTVTIPPEERDPELGEKLKAEWPGILKWAIEGCIAWQTEGLSAPEVVRSATADYLAGEDAIAHWIEDCCKQSRTLFTPIAALFESWHCWAESSQEPVGTKKSFSQALEAHGFIPRRSDKARGFAGIGLVTDVTDPSVSRVARARERPIRDDVSDLSFETDARRLRL